MFEESASAVKKLTPARFREWIDKFLAENNIQRVEFDAICKNLFVVFLNEATDGSIKTHDIAWEGKMKMKNLVKWGDAS